jgi:hypothetical protein
MNFDLGDNINQLVLLSVIAIALLFGVRVFQKRLGRFSIPIVIVIVVGCVVLGYNVVNNNNNNNVNENFLINPNESVSPIYNDDTEESLYEHYQNESVNNNEIDENNGEVAANTDANVNASVNANVNSNVDVSENNNSNTLNCKDLLPGDTNSTWAQSSPAGQGSLCTQNLLNAGHHVGVNTQGCSLRNANRGLRSEPANPQVQVGPWMQTTICPDINRRPLE